MSGHNAFTAVGNLGRDAELTHTKSGTPLLKMNVAVTTREKRGGEWGEHTEWVSAAIFGKRAEALGRLSLTKGTKVLVTGRVKARAYMGKDGEPKASLDLMADDIVLLGGGGSKSGGQQRNEAPAYGASASHYEPDGGGDFDDSIPFNAIDERGH